MVDADAPTSWLFDGVEGANALTGVVVDDITIITAMIAAIAVVVLVEIVIIPTALFEVFEKYRYLGLVS